MTETPEEEIVLPIIRHLATTEVPGDGRHVTIRLDEADRAALAAFADCQSVGAFNAELDVKPWGKTGFRVTGRVVADVVQSCVVTLEPVPSHIDEEVEVKLAPIEDEERYMPSVNAEGEIVVDLDEDLPDFFENGTIDVGALAVEFFMLGLDPYPRKPGVEFAPLPDPDKAELSPFAKLAVLKRPDSE